MEKINGICMDGKFYEAILPETDSCKGCAFQEEEFGCVKAHCHSFKPSNFGDAKHIFRYSPELTERLNNPKTKEK